ncbi:MAG: T9SS type A sorting domain-containing protein [Taibaiella sp.]|jgi:hypothetical protein
MLRTILFILFLSGSVIPAFGQSTADLETTMCLGDTAIMTVSVTDADSLQWYRNGNAMPGANKDTLITVLGGIYYLKAFRSQCEDISGDIRIFITTPTINDDYVIAPLGSLTTFDVLANDNAACGPFDKSSFAIVTPPAMGTLVSSAGGIIVYKPSPVKLGTDKFMYRVKDIKGRLAREATVSIELYIDCAILYPNPVEDLLHISVNNKKIYALKIFDATGREVYYTTISKVALTVDMSNYAQGLYLVELLEREGQGCTIKVLKK